MSDTVLKLVCAWCSVIIREGKLMLAQGEFGPSHGICQTCYKKTMDKFLDQKNETKKST